MTLTVRLDPELDARLAAESRRRGVTKSEVVKDAIERVLGLKKNPFELLNEVRSKKPMGRPDASTNTGAGFKAKLRAKRSS
ncbi:MAG: ribbon-helix-helix protein, CopG family [Micropepsaceae bacterium]